MGEETSRSKTAVAASTLLGDFILRPPHPGDLGWVVHRHGALYHAEYGWDASFETLVGRLVAEFAENFDATRHCCFIAEHSGHIAGSAFVVDADATTAKLRFVYAEPWARGTGLARGLVEACMAFARGAGYRRMTLWTNDVLVPARRLYARLGFVMVAHEDGVAFGKALVSETWERDL
jgi:GNAT superfamily N-acetyltransferase